MPVALVTGSSRGIGRAIALRLARDGFDIVINDLQSQNDKLQEVEKDVQALNRKCVIAVADVSKEEEVKAMVDKAVSQLGGLDVMVANAGTGTMGTFVDHTAEILDKIYSVNVRGTFLCFKYAATEMIKQGRGGRLIAASSCLGKNAEPLVLAYTASKFAIRGIMQTAAVELAAHGITANAYAPGSIDTDLLSGALTLHPDPDHFRYNSPLRKVGQPEDVAAIVSFIASPDAHLITGQTMSVDGGRTLS